MSLGCVCSNHHFLPDNSNFVTNSYGESWDSSCNKSVNLETDAKTLYYSLLKLKYSPSKYLEHKKDLSKHAS